MARRVSATTLFACLFLLAGISCFGQNVLVDGSHDAGVWWSPQSPGTGYDPALPHQGKPLADYLRSLGMTVNELTPGTAVTPAVLASRSLVIATPECSSYSAAELGAAAPSPCPLGWILQEA